ncbi:MAG: FAD-dependent oxidoreductase [Phreatobacter sp.]|uniref:NAD(P)/FAD-dependent oxidoreductase n=1 Tax=Phreatobacter sp. TaxID=1966341 RepID=UPI0027327E6B|nr:FAD-dependent oxidoreductase [Phreatobacter sp.]MDP2800379.1 FAD-dependent oxidoreductase [Phreatobacter sp.]
MQKHWAVVGAGIAGIAAARRLVAAGYRVTVLDKSRGIGGRMATRRAGDFQFDHGAQFFTARGAAFSDAVAALVASGQAAFWGEQGYVGTPGMSSFAKGLAAGLTLVGNQEITALRRGPQGWTLSTAEGSATVDGNGAFDGVVIAVPAPQAVPLATSAGIDWPGLARVRYAPCCALMLAFAAGSVEMGASLRPVGDVAIGWIARDDTKPGRPAGWETLVVHATPDWSRAHLEMPPEAIAVLLLQAFRALTGTTAEPVHAVAQRWRYALVEEALGEPFLWEAAHRIGACGDGCIGARVEAAFDSGDQLGAAIVAMEV